MTCCLAVVGSEYLVFNAESGSVRVDLSAVSGSRTVEWFNPATGQTIAGGTVTAAAWSHSTLLSAVWL
jgi:hypothetical protein